MGMKGGEVEELLSDKFSLVLEKEFKGKNPKTPFEENIIILRVLDSI